MKKFTSNSSMVFSVIADVFLMVFTFSNQKCKLSLTSNRNAVFQIENVRNRSTHTVTFLMITIDRYESTKLALRQ